MPTFNLLIKGKVQGVFYRASASEKANELGLGGWIKNRTGGDVEAVVTGSEEALQQFIHWCKKGPRWAKVSDVIVSSTQEINFDGFRVVS
jgi:acylphosphatase